MTLNILLLEGIDPLAVNNFKTSLPSANIEVLKEALTAEQLKIRLANVQLLGIRSKTKITAEVLEYAPQLLAIGCFCIGTNNVDLIATSKRGIPVFNSPYCSGRSVAELIIGEIICLARQLPNKILEMSNGLWNKSSTNCIEIRGKTIGLIGFGNIGSQLSVLAESLGMQVIFTDIVSKSPFGNAKSVSLDELLATADFVTLHVPETYLTRNMIGERELSLMKKGSYLLNASRGNVVDLSALKVHLTSGHLAGAALDVYPNEPEKNGPWFCELASLPNVILTPHIGGSTLQAQSSIGLDVSNRLVKYYMNGCTIGSVNMPAIDLPKHDSSAHRITNVHINTRGVLKQINNIFSDINISSQLLETNKDVGYLIIDVDSEASTTTLQQLSQLSPSIKTRILCNEANS